MVDLKSAIEGFFIMGALSKKAKYGKKDSVHFLLRFRGRIFV